MFFLKQKNDFYISDNILFDLFRVQAKNAEYPKRSEV
jgi:hypothetical protein